MREAKPDTPDGTEPTKKKKKKKKKKQTSIRFRTGEEKNRDTPPTPRGIGGGGLKHRSMTYRQRAVGKLGEPKVKNYGG